MGVNETKIRKALSTLKPDGELFEVRIIDGKWNASGYFTNAETLIAALKKMRLRQNANIYITLNAIKPECYARKQRDKIIEYATPTTSDTEIVGYEWMMVDLDPKRAAGTSSSDTQIKQAEYRAGAIYRYLQERGWSSPVVAMSGNGMHLLYKISLRNSKENQELIKNCLLALNMLFSDDAIDVDLKTYNPARICKLYGTMACKGASTQDRPHRMSYIVSAPESLTHTKKVLLDALAAVIPSEPEKPERYNNYNPRGFDLENWIAEHGLHVSQKAAWNGGTKWILEQCPFDSAHKGKDASIIQTADGKICFNCFHNSCADKHWRELRMLYEPDAYSQKYIQPVRNPNYQNPDYVVEHTECQDTVDGQPIFYTTEQIRLLKTPPEEFIPTGITVIDKKMRGLKKGFVTCMSGLRAAGKSSIISQITVEAAEHGYKSALFSGELTAKNTFDWILMQAAGRDYMLPTQYENFYVVKDEAKETISKWLDEKVYIYNNDYGNDFEKLLPNIKKCVADHKVDLVILDNLMAINISKLDYDKYQRQSLFVEYLEDFAKQANIHIIFVAHPRKSQGFLRLEDVAGTNDIVNRVDNALILHRVNHDFKARTKEEFKWSSDNELYQCTNVMEICKDRRGGIQDEFIPLYFEVQTKRLRNSQYENKIYGWNEWHGFTAYEGETPFDTEVKS